MTRHPNLTFQKEISKNQISLPVPRSPSRTHHLSSGEFFSHQKSSLTPSLSLPRSPSLSSDEFFGTGEAVRPSQVSIHCLSHSGEAEGSLSPPPVATGTQPDIIHVHEWQAGALPLLYWVMYHYLSLKKPML
ncbi:uncharacterized protein LOC132165231 [Corylus avellana]|uniref:uncharacterized protein LOC132165231 n=1 Tax=Corylus avellana TaxID=13451 RepID=UPI00286D0E0C|nr:uncharacterized protein LOC132165231 [Corylus avellana]